ncbi:MAG: UDP-3-O-acyl-N-acetylglucosamine deacetylase [Fimbriimonadaceae bacterium]
MTISRCTVSQAVGFTGRGLHSGEPTRVIVRPGENGLVFRRGEKTWRATPNAVTDTRRRTRLGEIETVEHLLSALAGIEVTDAEVEVEGPELPGLDGSARQFAAAMLAAGLVALPSTTMPRLYKRVFLQDGDAKIAISAGNGTFRYEFLTQAEWLPRVFETRNVIADYAVAIAPARTPAFEAEIAHAHAMGLGRGLDETSVVGLGALGYLNEPRFPDEPVRHKLLDLIGDLALAGVPMRHLNVTATGSGHTMHVEAARRLRLAVFGKEAT